MRWLKVLAVAGGLVLSVLIALKFFAPGLLPWWGGANRIAALLEADLVAVEGRTWPRSPLFDEPADGTAWAHYRLAIDPILDAEGGLSEAELFEAGDALEKFDDPDRVIPESLGTLLAAMEPGWLEVRRGACTSAAGWFFTPRQGVVESSDEIDRAYDFAGYLSDVARARAAMLASDDPDAAIEALMILHRFGEDFACGGQAITWMVGMNIQGRAVEMMGRLVTGNFLTHERVDRVLAWLDRIPDIEPDPLEIADLESLALWRTVGQVAEGEIEMQLEGLDPVKAGLARNSNYRVLEYFRDAWAKARADKSAEGVVAVGDEYRRLLLAGRPALLAEGESQANVLVGKYYEMTSIVYEKIDENLRKTIARRSAVALAIHAHRFKDENGRYPHKMDELVEFAGREFPGIEDLVYRAASRGGGSVFFFAPDLDNQKKPGRSAKPLARVPSD